MEDSEADRPPSPIRRVMRAAALVLMSIAALLIAAEWVVAPGGVASGALMSGGLVLCLSSSMLSIALLVGRNGN